MSKSSAAFFPVNEDSNSTFLVELWNQVFREHIYTLSFWASKLGKCFPAELNLQASHFIFDTLGSQHTLQRSPGKPGVSVAAAKEIDTRRVPLIPEI